jgi:hypothetical protein
MRRFVAPVLHTNGLVVLYWVLRKFRVSVYANYDSALMFIYGTSCIPFQMQLSNQKETTMDLPKAFLELALVGPGVQCVRAIYGVESKNSSSKHALCRANYPIHLS